MACESFLLFCISCLVCLSISLLLGSSLVHGGRAATEAWHVIPVEALLPADICSPSKGSSPSKLKVVHRHGPCSNLHNHGNKPTHVQLLNQDQSRVASLHRQTSPASKGAANSLAAIIPDHTGASVGTSNYIVTLGFGTPKKDLSVVLDTGSDLTWIQCKPCRSCYTQQDPLFDPAESSTYQTISCNSPTCSSSFLTPPSCLTNACRYSVVYGDHCPGQVYTAYVPDGDRSTTTGAFVSDSLTLTPTSDKIPDFVFGCGDQNSGLFGRAAGLVGLGRGNVSLVMQSAQKYGGPVFSYCLPSTSSSTGYLRFGRIAMRNVKYTPMLPDRSFYLLNLIAIKIGGRLLPVPSTTFTDPGTLIDSGTVISRLPPTAYAALRSAFRQQMAPRYPAAPALSILDTCYNFTGFSTVKVPTVAFVFGNGVSVSVDFAGILYVASLEQACLAFTGNDDDGDTVIIGNVQQRKYSVVYDLENQMIGFGPQGCR